MARLVIVPFVVVGLFVSGFLAIKATPGDWLLRVKDQHVEAGVEIRPGWSSAVVVLDREVRWTTAMDWTQEVEILDGTGRIICTSSGRSPYEARDEGAPPVSYVLNVGGVPCAFKHCVPHVLRTVRTPEIFGVQTRPLYVDPATVFTLGGDCGRPSG